MSFSCSTTDFPSLSSFEDAQRHWNKTKPIRGDSDTDPRPIGSRATNQRHKNMRVLNDGSIAFCLHDTDCVIWHPDGDLTVQGWASMSTTAFVNCLVPFGVAHGQGPKHDWEPILTLRSENRPSSGSDYQPGQWRTYWRSGMIIQCSRPVRLYYSAEANGWVPRDMDALEPFDVPRVDRARSREVAKEYHLATLEQVANAAVALTNLPAPVGGNTNMSAIMDALRDEQYLHALALMPRGITQCFGREHGTRDGIQPGFFGKLRNHIYRHEGAVERVPMRVLTPSQHTKYVADSRRFFG